VTDQQDDDFMEGYFDGRDLNTPEPSSNRSACYRHSFAVGRAEMAGRPIPAQLSRENARRAEEEDRRA
jgi:hypothetical protein